jgi:membrane fusion protein, heavy metal efflux system
MNAWKRQLAGAACLAALLVGGCKSKPKEEAAAAPQDPNVVTVTPALAGNLKFGKPQTVDVSGTLQVVAHVESDARRIARVGSPVAGRILRLVVFEGQNVRTGQVLATLHSTDLSDAQMQLIKADSQQNLAAAGVKRAKQLVEAEVIGRAELERREAEQVQAATDVASYRTQLRGLGMGDAQIRQLEANHRITADYPIVAPRSGIVLKRDVTVGQVVQPADLVFTIADLSNVWVVANVPEEDAGTLRAGMPVTVSVPALPKETIRGNLSYVSPVVDPATRTVIVRMEVPNGNGLLKPDELASMTLTGHAERKLTVPNTAVVREDNKDYVFVQSRPDRCVLREVSLGVEEDDRRVVQSGVTATDTIVLDGAFHLNNQRKQAAIKGGE